MLFFSCNYFFFIIIVIFFFYRQFQIKTPNITKIKMDDILVFPHSLVSERENHFLLSFSKEQMDLLPS